MSGGRERTRTRARILVPDNGPGVREFGEMNRKKKQNGGGRGCRGGM